jgi:hypothetical protein
MTGFTGWVDVYGAWYDPEAAEATEKRTRT